jgi:carboxylesterase
MTLMDHGAESEWVAVLIHGFTNCPEQFRSLGTILYEAGCNVVIPRVPEHGMQDRMTEALAGMTAEEMTELCDCAVDAAAGLGRRVVVVGLSSGGTMAAWVAQHRAVDRVLVISPVMGVPGLHPAFTRPAASFALILPNQFWWWDSAYKQDLPGPPYAYPRYPTRGIAEVLRLSLHVFGEAERAAPRARSITLVLNGNDAAVNFESVEDLRRAWDRRRENAVERFEFPAAERLHHDLIDPLQVDADIARVYPELIEMIFADVPAAEENLSEAARPRVEEAGPQG